MSSNSASAGASPAFRLGRGATLTLVVLAVLAALHLGRDLLLPLVLGLLISLVLAPPVHRLLVLGMPKPVAALLPVLALTVLVGGGTVLIGEALVDWLKHSARGIDLVLERAAPVQEQLEAMSDSTKALDDKVSSAVPGGDQALVVRQTTWREQLLGHATQTVATLGTALCLAFFLLVHGDRLFLNLLHQLQDRSLRRQAVAAVRECRDGVARYLGAVLLVNTLIGMAVGALLWALGVREPFVWGLVAGLLRFVPYLGVLVATTLLAVVSVLAVGDGWLWLVPPVGYWLTTVLVGMVLEPHLHGYRMAVNPAVILLAIIVWGGLWGVPGVLLAVPILTVMHAVAQHLQRLQPLAAVIAR